MKDKPLHDQIVDHYRQLIEMKHPDQAVIWPVISGFNCRIGGYKGWIAIIFSHTGNAGFVTSNGLGELPDALIGATSIDRQNIESVRRSLERHFTLKPQDGIVFVDPEGNLAESELLALAQRHELAMGIAPMKIFLSHKGFDKPMVAKFQQTLKLLGFDPWLDDDAMPAGTNLERGILRGFEESCAAVFFVTPQFKDENYLASEVDYAIAEKRKKGERFSIITLVFGDGAAKGKVPDLLHGYVWKEPKSELEALQHIIRALPIELGGVRWR